MRTIDVIRRALLSASSLLMGLLLVGLVTLDFLQVVMRYLLGGGFVWGADVAVIALLTLAWLGAGHAWLARAHISIVLFEQPRWIRVAANLLVIVGTVALAPLLMQTIDAFGFIDLPSLPLSAAVKYWPVAIGAAFLVLAALLDLVAGFQEPAA